MGRIIQLSISPGGVPKYPVSEAFISPLGLAGDGHNHPNIHGGIEKAVLILCAESTADLIGRGFPLFHGALGENITVEGLDRTMLRSGQRYRAGAAVIELTRLRAPCATLDVYGPELQFELFDKACKAGNPSSPRWARGGFYARVVNTGAVRVGDPIELLDQAV